MNKHRRAFFTGLAALVPAVAVAGTPAAPRQAFQGGPPQCPQCLDQLAVMVPRYDTPEREVWMNKDRHTLTCPRCRIDVVWRTKL